MITKLLKGRAVADKIHYELIQKIEKLKKKNITPGLAAVLIGDDPASKVYINSKEKAFKKLNCYTETFCFPENSSESNFPEPSGIIAPERLKAITVVAL